MPRARQGNAPTSKQSNHISLHHDTVRGPSMPCMCWWREKAKKALLEDFSPAPCFTCSMLRDTTLCDRIEAQLLRSCTYAHALFSSVSIAIHRHSHWTYYSLNVSAKKSQNMQKCSPQTLEQGIIHGYLHETRL
jgi:hypothetical protein